jgi:hypothetical protein
LATDVEDIAVLQVMTDKWRTDVHPSREEHEHRPTENVASAQQMLQADAPSVVIVEERPRFLELQSRVHEYPPNDAMTPRAQPARTSMPTPQAVA